MAADKRDERYIDGLIVALTKISEWGVGQDVIPCPQDYSFYIEPMQELAQKALEGKVLDGDG